MTTKCKSNKRYFYIFEMFNKQGKPERNAKVDANTYHKASSNVKKEYKQYKNHRLTNSNDPKCCQ